MREVVLALHCLDVDREHASTAEQRLFSRRGRIESFEARRDDVEARAAGYKQELGRNSIDNFGMNLILNVHFGVNYMNAFWDGDEMTSADVVTSLDHYRDPAFSTEAEYAALLTGAGWRLTRVIPTESPAQVVEGEPA